MHASAFILAAISATASAQSLTDIISSNSDTLSTFGRLVTQAGLVDDLSGMSNLTIFASTNDAFAAALKAMPGLLPGEDADGDDDSDNSSLTAALIDILHYHVLPGAPSAPNTSQSFGEFPGSFYYTLLGNQVVNPFLTNDSDGGAAVYSREKRQSNVVMADVKFDGGYVHVIDSVLLPPTGANTSAYDLGLTYFYGALQATDLASSLAGDPSDDNTYTFFIPTNQAFIDVGAQLANLSTSDLTTLLQYHVTNVAWYTPELQTLDSVPTLAQTDYDSQLDITVGSDGGLFVNNARVITANILLENGVVHLIDEVLNPRNDDSSYGYTYSLPDDATEGVPSFEDAASATVPALTSGISPSATYMPSATFSAASGADSINREVGVWAGLSAVMGLFAFLI